MSLQRREFLIGTAALTAAQQLVGQTTPLASTGPGQASVRPLKILVLGGTRFLGPAVVRTALAGGHQVTIFNRGQSNPWLFAGVDRRIGNRFPEQAPGLAALAAGRWDVVIDISAQYPRIVEESARLLASRTEHYILMSSIAVYGDYRRGGIHEGTAVLENPPSFRELPDLFETDWHDYGWRKVACERAVEQVFGSRSTIIRAGQLVGQELGGPNRSDGRWYWQARFSRDALVGAPGDGSDPVQPVDIRDLADFLVLLAVQKKAGTFNAVGPAIPFRQFLETAREVVGSNSEIRWLGRERSSRIFNVPYFTPYDTLPGFGTISNDRAMSAGMRFRPIGDAIRTDWQYFKENMPGDYDFSANGTGLTPSQEADFLRQV